MAGFGLALHPGMQRTKASRRSVGSDLLPRLDQKVVFEEGISTWGGECIPLSFWICVIRHGIKCAVCGCMFACACIFACLRVYVRVCTFHCVCVCVCVPGSD